MLVTFEVGGHQRDGQVAVPGDGQHQGDQQMTTNHTCILCGTEFADDADRCDLCGPCIASMEPYEMLADGREICTTPAGKWMVQRPNSPIWIVCDTYGQAKVVSETKMVCVSEKEIGVFHIQYFKDGEWRLYAIAQTRWMVDWEMAEIRNNKPGSSVRAIRVVGGVEKEVVA